MSVTTIPTHTFSGVLATDDVRPALAAAGIAIVTGFPGDARRYLEFLRRLGSPLRYYGGDAGSHPDDSAIWRIRFDRAAAEAGATHAMDGPLRPHSAQSLRVPRPPYFSMLMVDSGWQDLPDGHTGRSVLARWSEAFRWIHRAHPERYAAVVDALLGPVPFPDGESRSVAYRLPRASSDYDLGVRVTSGLAEFLAGHYPDDHRTTAVHLLVTAAERVALRIQLGSGDLVIVDNDRWAHGRECVIGARELGGEVRANPRELWSVTIGE